MVYKHKDPTNHDFWYPIILGLRTRMQDHSIHVFFGAPKITASCGVPLRSWIPQVPHSILPPLGSTFIGLN